jgi:hypothetical protein
MKNLLFLLLAASLLVVGCDSTDPSAQQDESLNFDVIGDDAPDSYDVAMSELAELDISVPNPVTAEQLRELYSLDVNSDVAVVDRSSLDERHRPHFRRILRHLHRQFRGLHECLENNDSRELRRIIYGAHMATRHGVRALRAGHPRAALHAFHRANRLLNLAHRICRGDGGGDRPEPCFDFVYPVIFVMPDGSTVTGNDREEIGAAMRAWYEAHPDVREEPALQYPVNIAFFDSDEIMTINSEEELRAARALCDEEDGDGGGDRP